MLAKSNVEDDERIFEAITGKKYIAKKYACLFCKHCSEILVDYTNGPYLVACELEPGRDCWEWFSKRCPDFEENKENEE